jgi:hypothetical protein
VYDDVKIVPYSIDGICSTYLLKTVNALMNLHTYMTNNNFSCNYIQSIEYLIDSFSKGSEQDFKKH